MDDPPTPPAHLVAGRGCGACDACCVHLDIPFEDGVKPGGAICPNCTSPGCRIYDSRPQVCRSYHCVWRSMPTLDEGWRPDLSGVLITWATVPEGDPAGHAVDLLVIGPHEVIGTEAFAGLIAGFVARNVATSLRIPRGADFLSTVAQVNTLLAPAIAAKDRLYARALLAGAYEEMMKKPPVPR